MGRLAIDGCSLCRKTVLLDNEGDSLGDKLEAVSLHKFVNIVSMTNLKQEPLLTKESLLNLRFTKIIVLGP